MRWGESDRYGQGDYDPGMDASRFTPTTRFDDVRWYATQKGRSVEIRERETHRVLHQLTPPLEWGSNWAWNITDDGTGVYLMRTPERDSGEIGEDD